MSWRKLASFDNVTQAGLIESLLAQHDIVCQQRNFYASGVMGDLPFVNSFPELWVTEEQFFIAQKLMQDSQKPNLASDWICRECQEQNPATFDICWSCQGGR